MKYTTIIIIAYWLLIGFSVWYLKSGWPLLLALLLMPTTDKEN